MNKLEHLTRKHTSVLSEMDSVRIQNKQLVSRISELENELKDLNGEDAQHERSSGGYAAKRKFTRTEMMRVLMEKKNM